MAKTKHGEAYKGQESAEYRSWRAMKNRCTNPNNAAYPRYGGRGIAVCARWDSFENFLFDMGRRPSPKHSIDRINNDGDYEPGNCRWATSSQQNSNYSRNRWLTLDGETRLLSEWSVQTGIPETTIAARIDAYGWPIEAALQTPVGVAVHFSRGKDRGTHCANGHEYTPENSGRNSAGWRFCRACSRQRSREYMRSKRSKG